MTLYDTAGTSYTCPLAEVKWQINDASRDQDAHDFFLDKSDVVIQNDGNYLVYAQVTFFSLVHHDSYDINVNNKRSVTCRVSRMVSQIQILIKMGCISLGCQVMLKLPLHSV